MRERSPIVDLGSTYRRAIWWSVVALGSAALFVPAQSFPGTQDVKTITGWIHAALRLGLAEGLAVPRDYPPASTVIHWTLVTTGIVSVESVVKLTNLATLVLFAVFCATRQTQRGAQVLAIFALSSAFLGYTDILFAPFAFFLSRKRSPLWAVFLSFLLMVLLKWTALVATPLILARMLQHSRAHGWGSALRAGVPAGIILTATLVYFSPFVMFDKFHYAMKTTVAPSANALNPHWLYALFAFDGAPYGSSAYTSLWPSYEILCTALTLLLCAGFALLWLATGASPQSWLVALRGTLAGYFLFAYSVHENHLFLTVLITLFGYWAGVFPRWQLCTAAGFFNANLFLFYGLTGTQRPVEGNEWVGVVFTLIGNLALIAMIVHDVRHLLMADQNHVVKSFSHR